MIKKRYVLFTSLISCLILYFIEQILKVDYVTKTISKVILFTLIPIIFTKFIKRTSFKEAFNFKRIDYKDFKLGFLLGGLAFFVIIISFIFLKGFINLNSIAQELQNKSGITPLNFIFVGLYITFGNSFLEEFFFRGYIFLNLYEMGYKKLAYIFSSLLFALYHIAIFKTWFNFGLILLALLGLITVGFVFDYVDTKSKNFVNSWIIHILADMAIILIGMRMFGMM